MTMSSISFSPVATHRSFESAPAPSAAPTVTGPSTSGRPGGSQWHNADDGIDFGSPDVQAVAFTSDEVVIGIEVFKLAWALGEHLLAESVKSQVAGHVANGNAEGS
jgi:hypothetical protein